MVTIAMIVCAGPNGRDNALPRTLRVLGALVLAPAHAPGVRPVRLSPIELAVRANLYAMVDAVAV